ncbi:endonuclease MutS2 [Thermosediminibacter oceani]|uniref:Endonuclease MutS2 n=1 Tax=Thermosediminibacter oceani (strain ATCC BAA-1034 / DSM 16646 / JW/IW-1228P) TaxID=555079 RepID=D9RXS3_THEOJ|nr:endonuclease MutS2 [Thermosediminibacter oceani]ADL08147.1 MutS2 family protein [Thermosediminibacter oceani DSM 16646]
MNERAQKILEFDKVKRILSRYAVSDVAKGRLLELKPAADEQLIKSMQRETSEGVTILRSGINIPLNELPDIRTSLKRATMGAVLTTGELLSIASVMKTSRLVKNTWSEKGIAECRIIGSIIEEIHIFSSLEDKIHKAIISENEIADGASPRLSAIRKEKRILFQRAKEKLELYISSPQYQKFLQEPIITIRNSRYVIPVKQEFRSSIPGVIHDQSASGATLYLEPMPVLQINNELRRLEIEEQKEMEQILREFSEKIAENREYLEVTFEGLVRLDFILAKAKYSMDIKGVEPGLNSRGYINIRKGRHPLLRGEVVPIDIYLGDEFTVLVITGPNTGGKTVSLKTVGLFALMAQAGLHLPAEEGTELSVFNEVFADIGDEQSIEQSLSTFSSHMKNIKDIVDKADSRSLVLLDELGAGTDPTEGAALAMAILDYFCEKGTRVVATTHYSELKAFAYSMERMENASVEFDVETLSPTYRLTIGIPGKSNAFEIAKRLGLKREIIELARSFLNRENIQLEDLLKGLEQERERAKREKEEIQELKKQYMMRLKELEDEKEKLRNREEKILAKAREKARSIIEKVNKEAEKILERLKEVEAQDTRQVRDRIIEEVRRRLKKASDDYSPKEPLIKKAGAKVVAGPINPGDKVRVESLNQEGYIVSVDEREKTAQVQIGIMKVNLPLSSLVKIQEEEDKADSGNVKYSSLAMEKTREISREIDLRGLTLDEALLKVDKYLDDASLAGLPSVVIIHGKGTGILRKGIQDMLKTRKDIKSFRPGNMNEGGLGVTVVEFR